MTVFLFTFTELVLLLLNILQTKVAPLNLLRQ